MRTIPFLLLLSLFLCGSAAAKPNAFLSMGMNLTNPGSDLQSVAANGGLGGEIALGLRNEWGEIYGGYFFSSYHSSQTVPLFDGVTGSNGDWTSGRALLGTRILPFKDRRAEWLRPFAGGGISLGSLRQRVAVAVNSDPSLEYSPPRTGTMDSGTSAGWFVEAGMRIQVSQNAALDVSGQSHHFSARFQGDRSSSTMNVILSGLQARLVYAL